MSSEKRDPKRPWGEYTSGGSKGGPPRTPLAPSSSGLQPSTQGAIPSGGRPGVPPSGLGGMPSASPHPSATPPHELSPMGIGGSGGSLPGLSSMPARPSVLPSSSVPSSSVPKPSGSLLPPSSLPPPSLSPPSMLSSSVPSSSVPSPSAPKPSSPAPDPLAFIPYGNVDPEVARRGYPLGFKSLEEARDLTRPYAKLDRDGTPYVRGSAVTRMSENPNKKGKQFREESDIDFGIASETLRYSEDFKDAGPRSFPMYGTSARRVELNTSRAAKAKTGHDMGLAVTDDLPDGSYMVRPHTPPPQRPGSGAAPPPLSLSSPSSSSAQGGGSAPLLSPVPQRPSVPPSSLPSASQPSGLPPRSSVLPPSALPPSLPPPGPSSQPGTAPSGGLSFLQALTGGGAPRPGVIPSASAKPSPSPSGGKPGSGKPGSGGQSGGGKPGGF